jgi:hypothetical protein
MPMKRPATKPKAWLRVWFISAAVNECGDARQPVRHGAGPRYGDEPTGTEVFLRTVCRDEVCETDASEASLERKATGTATQVFARNHQLTLLPAEKRNSGKPTTTGSAALVKRIPAADGAACELLLKQLRASSARKKGVVVNLFPLFLSNFAGRRSPEGSAAQSTSLRAAAMRLFPCQHQDCISTDGIQVETFAGSGAHVQSGPKSDTIKTARDYQSPLIIVCLGPTLPGDPPTPAPELLTESEAVRYLRLDTVDISDPASTLRRYRDMNLLRATQVSKRLFYRRVELDRFLERLTESNPR